MRRRRRTAAEHEDPPDDEHDDAERDQERAQREGTQRLQRPPSPGSVHSTHKRPPLDANLVASHPNPGLQRMGEIAPICVSRRGGTPSDTKVTRSRREPHPPAQRPLKSRGRLASHDDRLAFPAGRRRRRAPQLHRQGLPEREPRRSPARTTSIPSSRTRTARPPCSATSATVYNHGRLAGTGYLSILPVDQGIEHSAAASFAKNPAYFDPPNLCELALAGECNAIATTLGHPGPRVTAVRAPDPLHRAS